MVRHAPSIHVIITSRAYCEHICFIGASVDLVAFLCHAELFFVMFLAKLAFAAGAGGVYLLHVELEHKFPH